MPRPPLVAPIVTAMTASMTASMAASVAASVLSGCADGTRVQPAAASARSAVAHTGPDSPPTARCRATAGLPDPACTPGASDPTVRADNLRTTVCVRGYSKNHRPAEAITGPIKRERMTAYGFGDRRLSDFELDHLIPISLGGSPTATANLWVEFNDHPNSSDQNSKDTLEQVLFGQVCAGRVGLDEARRAIATDWPAAYRRYVGPLTLHSP